MPSFEVTIQTNTQDRTTYTIEVYKFTGVERLKELIWEKTYPKIPVESQRIFFQDGELLEEDYLGMEQYNIQEGSRLLLARRKASRKRKPSRAA